jgi:hypothetical protein
LDIKTGKEHFNYTLDDQTTEYVHEVNIKKIENKIYLYGAYFPAKSKRDDWEDRLGLYRIVLDEKGKEISKKYMPWIEANKFIKIKENGKLESGYRLNTKNWFIKDDGTISYLAEKYKEGSSVSVMGIHSKSKSEDMVLMNFDKDFNLNNINVIDKAVSKDFHFDYQFSQMIKNNSAFVFFFMDYKKDPTDKKKKWFLGINKYVDNKFTFEELVISSKDDKFFIYVSEAKEGYILMTEINQKEKYNQIRLEKLNL